VSCTVSLISCHPSSHRGDAKHTSPIPPAALKTLHPPTKPCSTLKTLQPPTKPCTNPLIHLQ
jgi:hypothetical protein